MSIIFITEQNGDIRTATAMEVFLLDERDTLRQRVKLLEHDMKSGDYEALYAQAVHEFAALKQAQEARIVEVCQLTCGYCLVPLARDDWKEAVLDQCAIACSAFYEDDPKRTLDTLIDWHIKIALDPLVSDVAPTLPEGYVLVPKEPDQAWCEKFAEPVGYQRIFDAIAAATTRKSVGIGISVGDFSAAIGGEIYTAPTIPAGWQPIDTAPKDNTLLLLLVEPEQCATEDNPLCRTIGGNNLDNDGEDHWQFAGWDWCNDRFTGGIGKVLAWMPLPAAPKQGDRMTDNMEQKRTQMQKWVAGLGDEAAADEFIVRDEEIESLRQRVKELEALEAHFRAALSGAERRIELQEAELAALKRGQGEPVAWQDIVSALKAVDAEAWERGRMYPQHSDEQDGDRAAIRRACGLIEWYATKGGSVAMRLPLWPKHPTSAPTIPTGETTE